MKGVLIIRADGNANIGLGHIMRSMTLANVFRNNGYRCMYITSKPTSVDIFERYNYSYIELDYSYDKKTIDEAKLISRIIKEKGADYILVDSYFAGNEYLSELRGVTTLICINSTREQLATDYLINENIACDRKYLQKLYSGSGTRLLLGAAYSLIRDEFVNVPYIIKENVRDILVTTGGGDQYNFMTKFIKKLKERDKYKDIHFTFISGGCNEYYDQLVCEASKNDNIEIIQNSGNMAKIMQKSDIAVSTGGTTVLELSVVGVPTIGIAVSDDQKEGLSYMGYKEIIRYAGHIEDNFFWNNLFCYLDELIKAQEIRKKMVGRGKKYIDGKGATRAFYKILGAINHLA